MPFRWEKEMSSCEKCWSDAHRGYPSCDVATEYQRLMEERRAHPCTSEEQAGPDATFCRKCGRMTCHQYTRECMACGAWPEGEVVG